MRRITNLTKRALISGMTLGVVGMLAQGMFSAQPAQAQTVTPPCSGEGLVNPVYIAGSSAVATVITAISPAFANAAAPITLVYSKAAGSCDGVTSIVSGTKVNATATYFKAGATTPTTCQLSQETITLGLSDVYATSCPDVTPALLAGVGDFEGPVQSMNFVVPAAATQNTISAEAAYLLVGFGADSETDWTNPSLYAFRNFQSGTQTMLANAIKVPVNKWPAAADKKGSGGVVTAISTPTGAVDQTIGILASNEADNNRMTIKRLAYQHYGQTCAYYPDSTYAALDKLNVRNGHYAVWGPLHMLTKVNAQGVPTNTTVKNLLDVLTGKTEVTGVNVVDLEIAANTTPQCAMNVKRTAEMGPISSYVPEKSCACYFDSKRGLTGTKCTACTTANAATVCKGATPVCNYGYCEAQ